MTHSGRRSVLMLGAVCMLGGCGLLSGCGEAPVLGGYQPRMVGNPATGKALLESYGCGSCHVIPGIRTARGTFGPPLLFFSRRIMIAGELPNVPGNVVRWIENPHAIEPGTAMPDLGVSDSKAHDMAAYLYTLH